MKILEGKTALITGAARGIGRMIALRFAQEGADVAFTDLSRDENMDTLEKEGLESVKALGEPFDPNFHEAVSELQDNSVKPGTVIQELQKGYTLNERLIRPAMVIVSKNDE